MKTSKVTKAAKFNGLKTIYTKATYNNGNCIVTNVTLYRGAEVVGYKITTEVGGSKMVKKYRRGHGDVKTTVVSK